MQVLIGWKEIAKYMGAGVRTVQRWEALGLPVHRPAGKDRGRVMAAPEELDVWMRSAPKRYEEELVRLQREVERLKLEISALKAAGRDGAERDASVAETRNVQRRTSDDVQNRMMRDMEQRTSKPVLPQRRREPLKSDGPDVGDGARARGEQEEEGDPG